MTVSKKKSAKSLRAKLLVFFSLSLSTCGEQVSVRGSCGGARGAVWCLGAGECPLYRSTGGITGPVEARNAASHSPKSAAPALIKGDLQQLNLHCFTLITPSCGGGSVQFCPVRSGPVRFRSVARITHSICRISDAPGSNIMTCIPPEVKRSHLM